MGAVPVERGVSSVTKRVIVIEDDAGVRRGVVKMLEKKFIVKSAGSPEEAMELLKTEPPFDAAVCDVHFPEIVDGVDLFRTASGETMRWIFMTGDENAAKALAKATGCECLLKPFSRADLERALEPVAGAS